MEEGPVLIKDRVVAVLAAFAVLSSPSGAQADISAGAYLAGRSAKMEHDYAAAAGYFSRALLADPGNTTLIEEIMAARVALGEVGSAVQLAELAQSQDHGSPLVSILIIASLVQDRDFDGIFRRYEGGENLGPLLDGLIQAWSQMATGDQSGAMATFDEVATQPGLRNFAIYHKALALASVGAFAEADDVLASSGITMSARLLTAHVEILSQMGRNDEAIAMIGAVFGDRPGPVVGSLLARLEAGEQLPLSIVSTPQDGIAEAFFSLAGALNGDLEDEYTLLYCRIAEHLRPRSVETALLGAQLLERLDSFDLASALYDRVPADHPFFYRAAMGQAYALRRTGDPEGALAVLQSLAESHADQPMVHLSLGDQMRRSGAHGDAVTAYTQAIRLTVEPTSAHWVLFYRRGISHHRLGDWDSAEADLRRALELRPEAHEALNFLGYSMVERRENLTEALSLIERAVAAQPEAGYIVDSLGWAYFQLGRHEDAVAELERAVELQPMNAIINDHLGDALWAVGRRIEARFQWRRSLSLGPTEDDRARILRKLEVGLDHVLEDESVLEQEASARD